MALGGTADDCTDPGDVLVGVLFVNGKSDCYSEPGPCCCLACLFVSIFACPQGFLEG